MKERFLNFPGFSRHKTKAKEGLVVKRVFLALVSVYLFALTIFGFEFLFSPYNYLPFNGVVQGKRYTWGHLVENNRYGFRDRDFKTPKPPDTYRVMVLGDSLTWGAGLAVEERYTAIAENLLSSAFPQKRFEVLNFGISGGPTTKERDILQEFQQEVEPDLIVVGFCLNDPQPKRHDYSIERETLTNSILGQAVDKISYFLADLGLPYTAKLLNDGFYRSAQKLGIIPDTNVALGRAYDPLSNEWQAFVQALKDLKKISDESNLPAPIFAILNQSGARNKLWSQWFHQAEKAAADAGFIAYNHEFEIAERLGNQSLVINKLDGHPSASVNGIYGEKLYRAIVKQLSPQP
jgi:lysophospholipase L1-like esterase